MNTESSQTKPRFTIVATPNGLVLSTPEGEFLLQSTRQPASREIDPVDLFGIQDSDPRALVLQTGQYVV